MSIFLEMEPFPKIRRNTTLWEVPDPYLVGGMPLVDLVDLLNLKGEGLGSLGSIDSALAEGTVS